MPPVDRAGTFRGVIQDFGVSVTNKAKLPQAVITFLATEFYDVAKDSWEDWKEYDQTITGYFVLVTLDASGQVVQCWAYDALIEAVGWDGETYSSLAAMDLKGKSVQFRVAEDEYEGKVTLKVNWIASLDAEIGLRKLSGKDLTDLDAKFGVASTKPKTAAKPPKAGKKKKSGTRTQTPPKPPAASDEAEAAPPEEPAVVESCTEEEAYNHCVAVNEKLDKPVPDHVLDDYWLSATEATAADPENVTNEEWAKVRLVVLQDCNIPF